jgi:hypothetical protein
VAGGRAELDSFDIVEGLALVGGIRLEVLNVVSLYGGLPGAWPQALVTVKTAVEALGEHWREFGRPAYAQFDNDTITYFAAYRACMVARGYSLTR